MGSGRKLHQQTLAVHGGTVRSQFGETTEAIFMNSGYTYDRAETAVARFRGEAPGFVYSRYGNPTTRMFEERMMAMEGAGDARSAASGMAAITAGIMASVRAGDHVVAASALFGSCRYVVETLIPRYGVETSLVDGTDINAWKKAVRPNTRLFFLESPSNPVLSLCDIAAVADLAHENGAILLVDNVFATPICQHPLALGADLVAYSATKHIDGHGRCMGGIILGSQELIAASLHDFMRQTGPTLSSFNAWVLLKGLETLDLRVREMSRNAAIFADAFAGHREVRRVIYPGRDDHPQAELARKQMTGFSNMVAIELEGGYEKAMKTLNALEVMLISNNLGDAKTLVTHPATTTHQRFSDAERLEMGIGQGHLRLSIGLEHVDDLLEDFARALAAA